MLESVRVREAVEGGSERVHCAEKGPKKCPQPAPREPWGALVKRTQLKISWEKYPYKKNNISCESMISRSRLSPS